MRLLLPLLVLLFSANALAQSDAGASSATVQGAEPVLQGEQPEFQYREPGTNFIWREPPPRVGACVGGSCAPPTTFGVPPSPEPRDEPPSLEPRVRFAYAGAVLGTVSAGVVLGSSIAIAAVHDLHSERITRGVWLGYFSLSTGAVALSSFLARHELGGSGGGNKAARTIGWTAFALALADGAILWAGAFNDFPNMNALTIGAGVIGACALLPHAFDAYVAARSLRTRSMVSYEPLANGLRVRF